MNITLNQPAPDFSAAATSGQQVSLSGLKGKVLVLYFYPKDNTPGCTTEGQDFRDRHADFEQAGAVIYGISKDSLRVHEGFRSKHGFPFELISDADEQLCRLFDVIKQKQMYGKQYEGIERSTFIIDREGVLRHEWRKVKVSGHVDEVLEAVRQLA
ncbi:peroxiredoxin [Halopseudomonas yangmingensis]|uniref:thioredoxin-dependent peroxiredoxin n=1 Tax=Halopseudomonas yangmingensis TaxID=1720063 RepID=A0A1I4NGY9_9GAMM|nr:peroxiredoxin [Halopseudomonas yangmingensis]SFM14842.1 peroxiredoxin Q/BCP [Halopseudomonas yangmingensis]